jgi:hypothetical protein
MPVTILPPKPTKEPNRSRAFNRYVRDIAAEIAIVRAAGNYEVAKIASALNERGIRAPSGGPLTFTTMYRILKRVKRLGLGPGPLSVGQALNRRPSIPRKRCSGVDFLQKEILKFSNSVRG